MSSSSFLAKARQHLAVGTSLFALLANLGAPVTAAAEEHHHHHGPTTPIRHVIVIIGENRTFDHVFATYQPHGDHHSVSNLLSKGIVNADGTPGPNFFLASQSSASDTTTYQLNPSGNTPYSVLPPVLAGGFTTAPFPNVATAMQFENGLENSDYVLLTTGGTGLPHGAVDTRIPNATTLPSGPFQLTSSTHPYDAYDNSPVHRFYQMWQQFDCNAANASTWNPSGCQADLLPWAFTTCCKAMRLTSSFSPTTMP
jgi:phospholipase C